MKNIDRTNLQAARKLIAEHPDVMHLTVATSDLNGILRGKKIPVDQIDKAFDGGLRMPLSTFGVDIWGRDPIASEEVYQTGDVDGCLRPTERGLIANSSTEQVELFLPCWVEDDKSFPYVGDPRHILKQITDKFQAIGLTPVLATELEFYFVDPSKSKPTPPKSPTTNQDHEFERVLSVDALNDFQQALDRIFVICADLDIPADSIISEGGIGQFEINLNHQDDPLKLADDTFLLKRVVKGCASAHGLAATFMAKPYGNGSGNGLHVHASLVDKTGQNIFDDGSEKGSDMLRYAVGGMLSTMSDFFLIFAPHQNSYRRFCEGSHAPNGIGWGYENRTAAIRIPGGDPTARRVEHRLGGADANPYLALSAILGGMYIGITEEISPPKPTVGDAYACDLPAFPLDWPSAINVFQHSDRVTQVFGERLRNMYWAAKCQEKQRFSEMISDFEYRTYFGPM